mmetsp:Transcript_35743/g.115365  ORF Transcript_35743/g.115365 Transcript_35743/m.115365 type:complete len:361 (+) Transcript_35743:240-1322(+)
MVTPCGRQHGAGSDERTTLEPTPSPFQCQKPHKLPDAPSSAQPRPARAARPGVAPPGHASRRRRRPGHGQPATEGGRRRGRRGAEGGGWRAGGGPARCVLEGHRTRPRQAAKGRAPHPPQDCALLGRLCKLRQRDALEDEAEEQVERRHLLLLAAASRQSRGAAPVRRTKTEGAAVTPDAPAAAVSVDGAAAALADGCAGERLSLTRHLQLPLEGLVAPCRPQLELIDDLPLGRLAHRAPQLAQRHAAADRRVEDHRHDRAATALRLHRLALGAAAATLGVAAVARGEEVLGAGEELVLAAQRLQHHRPRLLHVCDGAARRRGDRSEVNEEDGLVQSVVAARRRGDGRAERLLLFLALAS